MIRGFTVSCFPPPSSFDSPRTAHNLPSPRTPQASTLVFRALHKRNRRGSRAVYDSCTNLRKIGVQTRSAKRSRAALTARRYRTGCLPHSPTPAPARPGRCPAPRHPRQRSPPRPRPRGRPSRRLCAHGAGEPTQAQQPARPPAPHRPAGRCAGGPAHGRFRAPGPEQQREGAVWGPAASGRVSRGGPESSVRGGSRGVSRVSPKREAEPAWWPR